MKMGRREPAFCLLFEQAVTDGRIEDILTDAADARDFLPDAFTEALVFGVQEHREEIDGIIEKNIRGWSLRRLSKVALALLRLAVYEIIFDEKTADSVSINAVVELAKQYGGDDDPAYVNGVLSTVVREKTGNGEATGDE